MSAKMMGDGIPLERKRQKAIEVLPKNRYFIDSFSRLA